MAISRRQLAAALLEYDNLDAPPSRPLVSHRDSAIFRPSPHRPPDAIPLARQGYHHPGGAPAGEHPQGRSHLQQQHDGAAPRRPNTASAVDDLDLARWDLPEHLLASSPDRRRSTTDPRGRQSPPPQPAPAPRRPSITSPPLSDRIHPAHLDAVDGIPRDARPADAYDEANEAIARARHVQTMYDARPARIPLPSSPASTRPSLGPGSAAGDWDAPGRRLSLASRSSYDMLRDTPQRDLDRPASRQSRSSVDALRSPGEDREEVLADNPFALPPPPAELGSRFDPKTLDAQRRSIDLTRPASRLSVQFDPSTTLTEAHLQEHLAGPRAKTPNPLEGRTFQTFPAVPTAEEYGKPLRTPKYRRLPPVDRHSLLRPKTLIMPAPLASAAPAAEPPSNVPDGYVLGDKPLPPGSRSSILTTDLRGRPGLPLSLSQKTFRSSLIVGGRREEEEYWVGGATEEGQLAVEYAGEMDQGPVDRRPGKLYGRSLMDQLEARKAALKSKQRTFAGDMRPAMMAREAVDPAVPDERPVSTHSIHSPHGPHHAHMPPQPLLTMDSSGELDLTARVPAELPSERPSDRPSDRPSEPSNPRMTKSRSVFGVDTIWEKEMAKLRAIHEAEARAQAAREAAQRQAQDALEGKRKRKEKKKKKSGHEYGTVAQEDEEDAGAGPDTLGAMSPIPHVADLPPQVSYSPERAPPAQIVDRETGQIRGDEGDLVDVYPADRAEDPERLEARGEAVEGKGELVERREELVERREELVEVDAAEQSDSSEDVPLSRLARAMSPVSDSDEDVPLSQIRSVVSPTNSVPPAGSLGLKTRADEGGEGVADGGDGEDGEDDVPLMVRRTVHLVSNTTGPVEDVEDDLPLGFKHADAVVRKSAGHWRHSTLPSAFAAQPDPMAMALGAGGGGYAMMGGASPYGYPYSMPPAAYPSPSMLHLAMGGMGWPGQGGMGIGMGMPMVPLPGGLAGGPEQASKNIDSWRKEVAIQPVPTGNSSVRSGSAQ